MRIKTKLIAFTLSSALLMLVIFFVLFIQNKQVEEARRYNALAFKIVHGMFELNILTSDYYLRESGRAQIQWQQKHEAVAKLFALMNQSRIAQSSNIIEDLMRKNEEIRQKFSDLITYKRRQNDSLMVRDRLIGMEENLFRQLSASAQDIVTSALQLAVLSRTQLEEARNTITLVAMLSFLILMCALVGNALYTSSLVSRPLKELTKGTKMIGTGDLEYRIPIKSQDEMGHLAQTFNKMSQSLLESHTDLEEKVADRTRQLESTNKSLQLQTQNLVTSEQALTVQREELIAFNERLKDQQLILEEQKISLEEAKDALEKNAIDLQHSNAALKKFAYIASHDLQEPLRMISGFSTLLKDQYKGRIDEQADKYLGYMAEGSERLQDMIQGLLSYSRLEAQMASFEPCDLNKIILSTMENLNHLIVQYNVTVYYDNLPSVNGNPMQIGQVFQNLVSNAIKYRSNAIPKIEVTAQLNGERWKISFKDNGVGVEEKYYQKIFELFQRLHTRQHSQGTGMGLAICQQIIKGHGGKIWIESKLNQGSTFIFTLPAI